MVLDVVVMSSSADRTAADVAIPIALGETHVSGNGVPGTATQWYPKKAGAIVGVFCNGETAAMIECWWNKTTDVNRNYIPVLTLQTAVHSPSCLVQTNYPITEADAIQAAGDNAAAKLNTAAFWVSKGGYEPAPSPVAPGPVPQGSMVVNATATYTHVADSIAAEGTLTFHDFQPVRDQWYKIIGLSVDAATGHVSRLNFKEGPNVDDKPGVPCADSVNGNVNNLMWYGNFGMFRGQTPPTISTLSEAADASDNVAMLIVPVSGGK